MELHQLRYLVSVVDEGSFTAAAQREHVSQSGISAQVAKLERELGQRLLDRGARSVELTPAGAAVLPLARAALAVTGQIERTAQDLTALLRGKVRVGMIIGCAIPPFLDAIAQFGLQHPGVEVQLHEGNSDQLQSRVLTGSLDLALVGYGGEVLQGLQTQVLVDEPVAIVVPTDHPLARRRKVRLAEIEGQTLFALSAGSGVRTAFDSSCTQAGVAPTVAIEASSPETIMGLARRGAGIAVLSASIVGPDDGLVAVPIVDAQTSARLGVVTPVTPLAPAARELHRLITDAMGAEDPT